MLIQEEIFVKTSKEYSLAVIKFTTTKTPDRTLVISSATGVLQKYYQKIATYFANYGYAVYTFDYSGIGKSGSEIKKLKRNTNLLSDWGSIDQASIIDFAKSEYPTNKITLITHSIGGQLIGFNPNYHFIDNIITVASQSGYWKYYEGIHKPKMWLFWYSIIPVFTEIYGYFPAKKLGLFENLPKSMVYEWSKLGKHKDYIMGYYSQEETYFHKIDAPALILSFPRDSYAPKKAVDWLANQFVSAQIDRRHLVPEELGLDEIGHFGFFREKFSDSLWKMIKEWINEN